MKINIYQVDAFTKKAFGGNPAAVCPLPNWLPNDRMQNIAMENNLAETAFYVQDGNQYQIRWFTPIVEVDLCGHATLAAAYVLFNMEGYNNHSIQFHSPRSGNLTVKKEGDLLTLNFPADELEAIEVSEKIIAAFNIPPQQALKGKTDFLLVYNNEDEIKNLIPNISAIEKLGERGVIVTAKGNEADFVSRFFAPQSGINEDPVTGSAHTSLTPYWHTQLKKKEFSAIQLSERKGYLQCRYLEDRIEISGEAVLYMSGEIYI